jgi:hypothetical protein
VACPFSAATKVERNAEATDASVSTAAARLARRGLESRARL